MRGKKVLGLFLALAVVVGCATEQKVVKREGPKIELPSPPPQAPKPKLPPAPEPVLPMKRPSGYGLQKPVTVTVREASLKELLLTMAKQAGVNIVMDEDIENRRVSITLHKVPLWQALKAVLEAHGLYWTPYPGYLRVSRMVTRFFHIDYVVSARGASSTTSVVLVSGGTEGSGATSSNVVSSEEINFWQSFEERLKSLMRDPLYEILDAEYRRRQLQKDLALLPYEEDYEKALKEHKLKMFSLQSKMMEKQLEMGITEEGAMKGVEITEAEEAEARTEEAEAEEAEEVRIVGSYTIDPHTGTVVVTTTPDVMERVERFIAEVKEEAKRQVLIDVQILEVSLSKDQALGVDWSGFPGTIQLFRLPDLETAVEKTMAEAGGGGGGGTTAAGIVSPLATPPFSISPTGGLQLGVLNMLDEDWAYQHTINALISFLRSQGEVKAIARPQLVTMNNQPAIVSVGLNDFYVTYELTTTAAAAGGIATSQVTSKLNPIFIGVTLHITPQISPTGEVILKIVPAINRKVGEKTVPTGIPSAPTQTIPIIETRQTSTIARVRDGQIVILSGLIQEKEERGTRKVLGLGDVPIIGGLFRYKAKGKARSELVIIVTPRVREPFYPGEETGYKRIGRHRCTRGSSA